MDTSRLSEALVLVLGLLVVQASSFGGLLEPDPDPASRDLRPDYVKTWYIFNDSVTNGILAPGDTHIETFKNWWTPVSAHTQHNMCMGPLGNNQVTFANDQPSGPMNYRSTTNASENYWLQRDKNSINFYMTFSQYDNNDWATYDPGHPDPNGNVIATQRNYERNGYALGWVIHELTMDANGNYGNDESPAGSVKMDIFVHYGLDPNGSYVDGNGVVQASRSDPQVSMSNDIDANARDFLTAGGQRQPPDYDGTPDANGFDKGYTWALNQLRFELNGHGQASFDGTVNSMEVYEVDPNGLGAGDVIVPDKRPSEILNSLNYVYEDAYLERNPDDPNAGSVYVNDSTDGGVIAGLSGYDEYNHEQNNWEDQQVIRIDIAEETIKDGNITAIRFFDFGDSSPGDPNTQQTDPREIVFGVDANQTFAHGQIYFDSGAGLVWFPENRIYIARVTVPEPTALAVLAVGTALLAARRRRRSR